MTALDRPSLGVRLVRFLDSDAGIFLILMAIIAGVLVVLGVR